MARTSHLIVTGAIGLVMVSPKTLQLVELGLILPANSLRVWISSLGPALECAFSPLDLAGCVKEHQWLRFLYLLTLRDVTSDLLSEAKGFTQWAHWHFNNLSARHQGPLNCRLLIVFSRNTIFQSQVKETVDSLNGIFDLPIKEMQWLWLSGVPSWVGEDIFSWPPWDPLSSTEGCRNSSEFLLSMWMQKDFYKWESLAHEKKNTFCFKRKDNTLHYLNNKCSWGFFCVCVPQTIVVFKCSFYSFNRHLICSFYFFNNNKNS